MHPDGGNIRVLIVDDSAVVRTGLTELLNGDPANPATFDGFLPLFANLSV